jgi:hypothetical protein
MSEELVLYPTMEETNYYSNMPIRCTITDAGELVLADQYAVFRLLRGPNRC